MRRAPAFAEALFFVSSSILAGGGELTGNGDVLWNVLDTWFLGLTGFLGWGEEGIPQGLKPLFLLWGERDLRLKPWGTQMQQQLQRQPQRHKQIPFGDDKQEKQLEKRELAG